MVKHHKSHHRAKTHRKSHRRTQHRRRGGMAPVSYSLSGSWPSQMSLGQGVDYERYHEGQHGGSAPYPTSVADAMVLPANMRAPAMVDGTMQAYSDVRGLRDPPFDQMATPAAAQQQGGRKRKHRASRKRRASRKHRGGSLGYAPTSAPTMLLTPKQYDMAGLNPDYRGAATEYMVAKARDINQGAPWA